MATESAPAPRRYPLHVTLSVAFTSLLVLLGFSLILFGYFESRKIALLDPFDCIENFCDFTKNPRACVYVLCVLKNFAREHPS